VKKVRRSKVAEKSLKVKPDGIFRFLWSFSTIWSLYIFLVRCTVDQIFSILWFSMFLWPWNDPLKVSRGQIRWHPWTFLMSFYNFCFEHFFSSTYFATIHFWTDGRQTDRWLSHSIGRPIGSKSQLVAKNIKKNWYEIIDNVMSCPCYRCIHS